MQVEYRNGERVCIGFEEEYTKFRDGKESEILLERNSGKTMETLETLYTLRDTTGGVVSCNASGILPLSFREYARNKARV